VAIRYNDNRTTVIALYNDMSRVRLHDHNNTVIAVMNALSYMVTKAGAPEAARLSLHRDHRYNEL
jgi:hypothetical protein